MNDSASALRALLDDLDAGALTIPEGGQTRPEVHPRAAGEHKATDGAGVKGAQHPAGTPQAPLTPATAVATHEATQLAQGDLVRWRTARSSGYGQLDRIEGGRAHVRPLLPARSHAIQIPIAGVVRLCSLDRLLALLGTLA